MRERSDSYIFLPGAGAGGEYDMESFASGLDPRIHFEIITYPGWQRYVADDFSAEVLIEELTAQIVQKVPTGPIVLVGLSIGGHFGYAAALRLQEMGREVAGFCAIDSFIMESAGPSKGWQSRALGEALELVQRRRFGDLLWFVRSKAWRALLRLAGRHLAGPLRRLSAEGRTSSILAVDAAAENELSMRLLIREAAPWVASLDRNTVPLTVPAVLLRTQFIACDDALWRQRCPNITICELPGKHHNLFEPENLGALHNAFLNVADGFCV